VTSSVSLPRACSNDVIDRLWALEREEGLDQETAQELLSWLRDTEFTSRNFWVGEIAASLIRDRGGRDLRCRLKEMAEAARDWQLFLCLTALRNEADWSDLKQPLARAAACQQPPIRALALELQHRLSTAIGRAEMILGTELTALGASCATFYVRDPWWHGEYRLVLMPGVTIAEPMHGFVFPQAVKQLICEGDPESYFADAREGNRLRSRSAEHEAASQIGLRRHLAQLIEKDKLFGSFLERENVASFVRLHHRDNHGVAAVLFVNFAQRIEFAQPLRAQLRALLRKLVDLLPEIDAELRQINPLPTNKLTRILQSSHQLTDSSIEWNGYFQNILDASLAAFGVTAQTGFGTIHLFDPHAGVLELVAHKGDVDRKVLESVARSQSVFAGEGVISWVALKRRSLLIENLPSSPFRRIHKSIKSGIRSELAVPMLFGNCLIGVLNLESTLPAAFSREYVRMIWYAVNQAALMYQTCQHEGETNRTLADALIRLSARDAADHGKGFSTLNELARVASDNLHVEYVDIWRYNKTMTPPRFDAAGSSNPAFQHRDGPRPNGWSNYIRDTGWPVWIANIREAKLAPQYWDPDRCAWQVEPPKPDVPDTVNPDLALSGNVFSELGVPIADQHGQGCVGVMWLKFVEQENLVPLHKLLSLALWFAEHAALVMNPANLDAKPSAAPSA
jgi:putative methionine-R-sulfoxide reductase with GAF domain